MGELALSEIYCCDYVVGGGVNSEYVHIHLCVSACVHLYTHPGLCVSSAIVKPPPCEMGRESKQLCAVLPFCT